MAVTANAERSGNEGLKQIVKFCLIGASSTVVDLSISYALMHIYRIYWLSAFTLSFAVAVTNGYIWNSLWTFRGMGAAKRHLQYLKFVAVNVVGYALNSLIMALVILLLAGHLHDPSDRVAYTAKAVAIVLVTSWNFLANKRWTFAATQA